MIISLSDLRHKAHGYVFQKVASLCFLQVINRVSLALDIPLEVVNRVGPPASEVSVLSHEHSCRKAHHLHLL